MRELFHAQEPMIRGTRLDGGKKISWAVLYSSTECRVWFGPGSLSCHQTFYGIFIFGAHLAGLGGSLGLV